MRHRAGRRRRRTTSIAVAVALTLVVSAVAAHQWRGDRANAVADDTTSTPSPTATPEPSLATPTTTPVVSPTAAASSSSSSDVQAAIAGTVEKYPASTVSVAALNLTTGATFTSGSTAGQWTASVYKLFVLEALLLQHQQNGTTLTGDEDSLATSMIENSDNDAGYSLFLDVGGNSGLDAALDTLGLAHTTGGLSDAAFTTTTATDVVNALKLLVTSGPLDSASRAYALGLMSDVESDQRWGVGVTADSGTTFANKNGWLSADDGNGPGEDDDGRWIVNSVGIVTVGGDQVLMAVLTEHDADFDTGVALVQSLARTAASAVTS